MTGRYSLRNLNAVFRDEMVERDRIAALLRLGPLTIPEVAARVGAPVNETTKWVMAMRRFGRVRELPKARADDYFRYELIEEGR